MTAHPNQEAQPGEVYYWRDHMIERLGKDYTTHTFIDVGCSGRGKDER